MQGGLGCASSTHGVLLLEGAVLVQDENSVSIAGLWYPRLRVRSRPKLSDFSGEKIHIMPSWGGSKAISHVADLRGMSKNPGFTWKSKSQAKLTGHLSPVIPSFSDRGLSCRLHVEAPRGESGNV